MCANDSSSLLLLENCRHLGTMDGRGSELRAVDLLVEGPRIRAIGPALRQTQSLPPDTPTIDASSHLVLPGFVNTHHHFFQVLTRCLPRVQAAPLFHWLVEQYKIFEAFTPDHFDVAARVAIGELLLTGCTTTSDHHYLFPAGQPVDLIDGDIRAARELGIRFHATRGSMTLGEADGGLPRQSVIEPDDRVLADYRRLVETYHDPNPLAMTRIALAPCAPFNVTGRLFRETVTAARELGVRLHTHLAETDDEDAYCLQHFGKRPFAFVADQGWSGDDIWFAHCVKLNGEEIAAFAEAGIGVAHCPSANARLGSGVAPIPAMLQAGAPVGLGVDGSASNDSGDLLGEARLALLIHRAAWGVDSLTPRDVLWMLTRGGAAVLGRDDIGRLEPGAAADIVLFNMDQFAYAGGASVDPIAALVLCGTSHHVDWSIVNGRIVVERGRIPGVDEVGLVTRANALTEGLVRHGRDAHGIDFTAHASWPRSG